MTIFLNWFTLSLNKDKDNLKRKDNHKDKSKAFLLCTIC